MMLASLTDEQRVALRDIGACLVETHGPLGEEAFLAGPDHDTEDLDIDWVFETYWEDGFKDLIHDCEVDLRDQAVRTSLAETTPVFPLPNDYRIVATEDGDILAMLGAEITGFYAGASLLVHPDHRRKGLGTALVIARLLETGGLPTWSLDTPAYSPTGEATHMNAFQRLMGAGLFP